MENLSLPELRSELRKARTWKRRKQLRQLIRVLEAERDREPERLTRRLTDAILALVISGAGVAASGTYSRLLAQHRQNVQRWLEAKAIQARRLARSEHLTEIYRRATPAQRRGLFGIPFDSKGFPKPPPGRVQQLDVENPTEIEVLEHLSPLLVVDGDATELRADSPIERVLASLPAPTAAAANISPIAERSHSKLAAIIRTALGNIGDNLTTWFREFLLRPTGLLKRIGHRRYVDFVGRDAGTLVTEQRGAGEEDIRDILGDNVYVGYTIHSAFAENTRPQHAFRDGKKFYRDNREGSYKPWEDRIRPPYYYHHEPSETGLGHGGNCLCFTIAILETPEGAEFNAEFGLRNSGGNLVTPRDVGTLRDWFNAQRQGVRSAVIGADRWEALADASATFEDFYDQTGRMLTPRELRTQAAIDRVARVDRVRAIMDAQHRRYLQAWSQLGYSDRFDGDAVRERAYLERLRRFLERIR